VAGSGPVAWPSGSWPRQAARKGRRRDCSGPAIPAFPEALRAPEGRSGEASWSRSSHPRRRVFRDGPVGGTSAGTEPISRQAPTGALRGCPPLEGVGPHGVGPRGRHFPTEGRTNKEGE
jgi:hypothetical protein